MPNASTREDGQPRHEPRHLPRRRRAGGIVPLDVPRQHDAEHQKNRHRTDVDQDLQGRQKLGLEQHEDARDREEKPDQIERRSHQVPRQYRPQRRREPHRCDYHEQNLDHGCNSSRSGSSPTFSNSSSSAFSLTFPNSSRRALYPYVFNSLTNSRKPLSAAVSCQPTASPNRPAPIDSRSGSVGTRSRSKTARSDR